MNQILGIGDWFAQNWMILVLIVVAIALLVPTYLRQKKEANARSELNNTIKKGTRIITTAGVYGVVESVEETTDGKVVTILTGTPKNLSSMTIHINAIGGIDNKSTVVVDESGNKIEDKKEESKPEVSNEETTESSEAPVVEVENTETAEVKKPAKKTTTKKASTSKK